MLAHRHKDTGNKQESLNLPQVMLQSIFIKIHKVGNVGTIINFVFTYFYSFLLFGTV